MNEMQVCDTIINKTVAVTRFNAPDSHEPCNTTKEAIAYYMSSIMNAAAY